MPQLTQLQVKTRLMDRGLAPRQARIGSAIALCEAPTEVVLDPPCSDFSLIGDQALANDKWGYSYGGFQIRSLREQKGTGGIRDEDQLLKVAFNLDSTVAIFRSQGWWPWSTFRFGQYEAYLQDLFPPPPGTYTVVGGDTLSGIAEKLHAGWTWEDLARVNGLHEPYSIFIGQSLLLP